MNSRPVAALAATILVALGSAVSAQAGEEADRANEAMASVLGPVLTSTQRPHLRTQWIREQGLTLARTLSTRREAIQEVVVDVGDSTSLRTGTGDIRSISIDQWWFRPDRITIHAKDGRWRRNASPGASLEIRFVDDAAETLPAFSGWITSVRTIADGEIVLDAHNLKQDWRRILFGELTELLHMKHSDLVAQLASEIGLSPQTDQTDEGTVERFPVGQRETLLSCIYRIGREVGFEAFVRGDEMRFEKSAFTRPPTGRRTRHWEFSTTSHVAEQLASELGLRPHVHATSVRHERIDQRNETDFDFLHRLAEESSANPEEAHGRHWVFHATSTYLYFESHDGASPPRHATTVEGSLFVKVHEAWAAGEQPSQDWIRRRILVRCRPSGGRAFTVVDATPEQAQEGVPLRTTTLTLEVPGQVTARIAPLPSPIPDERRRAAVDETVDRLIAAATERQATLEDAEFGFKVYLAQAYRTTLIELLCAGEDGVQRLRAALSALQ